MFGRNGTPPKNQPTGGCPHGYADWCLAREIVKTVKTEESEEEVTPVCQERLKKLVLLRRTDFQRLVARWPELLSRIQFFAAHKDLSLIHI